MTKLYRTEAKRRASRKMVDIPPIVLEVLRAAYDWLRFKRAQPKLRLTHRFLPDLKLAPCAGNLQLEINNFGRRTATGPLIELTVYKPRGSYRGYKLFFNEDIGSLESLRGSLPGDILKSAKAERFRFRLKPEIFINPGDDPLWVAFLVVVAFEYDPPEDLDCELEWRISFQNVPAETGRVSLDGAGLKRTLLANWPLPRTASPGTPNGCIGRWKIAAGGGRKVRHRCHE